MKAPVPCAVFLVLAAIHASPALAEPLPVLPDPEIEPAPAWSAAIDGYAGFGLLVPEGDLESHSLLGGLTRLRYRNVTLGGFAEYGSFAAGRVFHVGGAVGAYLPFRHFVDLEGSLGLGLRRYSDDDTRYGAGGYEFSAPALSLRMGISDRAGGVLGGRIGAQVAFSQDLDTAEVPWEVPPSDQNPEGTSGIRFVGGTSVLMLVVVGLDVAPGAIPPERVRR